MVWWSSRRGEDRPALPDPQRRVEAEPQASPPVHAAVPRSQESRLVPKLPAKSEGEPLFEEERARLESGFQQELGEVRVHWDEGAAQLAEDVGAQAVTVGRDVYFAAGAYSSALLAHEVGHVIQQQRATSAAAGESAPLEHQAEAAAAAVVAGNVAEIPASAAVPTFQRQAVPGRSQFRLLPSYSLTLDHFDVDDDRLSADHRRQLDGFAERLKNTLAAAADSIVTIEGFADSPGSEAHNLTLGQQRADAVRDYLLSKGVAAGPMSAVSGGESSPAVSSKSYEPRNRRVEINVIERSFLAPSHFLTPPTPPISAPAPPQNGINLTYRPELHMPTPDEELQDNLRIVDQAVKEAAGYEKAHPGTSAADAAGRVLRNAARKLGLPKWVQDKAESLGKDLPSKGADAVINQLAGEHNLDVNYKNAVEAAIKALAQLKVK